MPEHPLQPPELSDETLIDRVKRGDVLAFTQLYDRYGPAVYAMAAHLLGPVDAEEIVQEVFLRLWHKGDQYDDIKGSFRAWFMTIARHRIVDALKQRNQEQQWLALKEVDELLAEAIDPAPDVADAAWARQQQELIAHAIQALPAEQRRAIVMAYFGGFSQSAIAQQLGWPLGTVKKRIRLGIQKLRDYLRP